MKVSVAITTYNHEDYIAQALDSVLMQKNHFDYEIIVGEDDSDDKTRSIVKEYKRRYPDKIKLFLNDRKNVIFINGRPTGRWNFSNNLKNAKGRYIALLEGDDYWTDPLKLQQQVDFLDNNPDFSICFHNMRVIYEDCRRGSVVTNVNQKEITTIKDLAQKNYIYTASCMLRNGILEDLPEWWYKVLVGDWPLYLLYAQLGKIKRINQVMGVYRIHKGGIWGSRDRNDQIQLMEKDGDILIDKFDEETNAILRANHAASCFEMGLSNYHSGNTEKAIHYVKKSIQIEPTQLYKLFENKNSEVECFRNSNSYVVGSQIIKLIRPLKKIISYANRKYNKPT